MAKGLFARVLVQQAWATHRRETLPGIAKQHLSQRSRRHVGSRACACTFMMFVVGARSIRILVYRTPAEIRTQYAGLAALVARELNADI